MSGCRRACIVQLALWAALAAAFYFSARSVGRGGAEIWPASIGLGLLAGATLVYGWSAFGALAEQRLLTRPPLDGQWSAVCGEVRAQAPARAPLSGEPVAAYEYSITRDDGVGRSRSLNTYFYGKRLTPASIGTVRLLAVAALEVDAAAIEKSRALANASEHLRTAMFEKRDTAAERTSALEREWSDDDGAFRTDRKYSDAALDDSFQFTERHIRDGESVCAFAVYSSARNALVPDEKWGRPPRIVRGTAREIATRLGRQAIGRILGTIGLAAITTVAAVAYLSP